MRKEKEGRAGRREVGGVAAATLSRVGHGLARLFARARTCESSDPFGRPIHIYSYGREIKGSEGRTFRDVSNAHRRLYMRQAKRKARSANLHSRLIGRMSREMSMEVNKEASGQTRPEARLYH